MSCDIFEIRAAIRELNRGDPQSVRQRINKPRSATVARFIDEQQHECISSGLNRSYLYGPLDSRVQRCACAVHRCNSRERSVSFCAASSRHNEIKSFRDHQSCERKMNGRDSRNSFFRLSRFWNLLDIVGSCKRTRGYPVISTLPIKALYLARLNLCTRHKYVSQDRRGLARD